MAQLLLALLLLLAAAPRSSAQPEPKCAPRSTEASPSCAAAFAGSWTGLTADGGTALFDQYSLSALDAGAAFTAAMVHGAGWARGNGTVDVAALTATLVVDSGAQLAGVLAPGCQRIAWDNGSVWQRFVRPPRPLRVHIAPHTHNDVGWRETYMEYYNGRVPSDYGQNVSLILNSVIPALLADPKRRFAYVEQAYFVLWFETQSLATQAQVKALVASRQLVFLNGAWSMSDEASPTWTDMLDNSALGQRHIVDAFGVAALPTLSWTIDPFGHSAFGAVLSSSLGGSAGQMWGREEQAFKAQSCASQRLERVWLPSASLGGAAATFGGVFSGFYYCTPFEAERCDNEYGPTPATCGAAFGAIDAPALMVDLEAFLAPAVRGDDVLVLMGDDFTFENAALYFAYLDALIEALNADPAGRFEAFYSTPADYVEARLAGDAATTLPVLTGDLMPYTDDSAGHNVWAGYFTSRPSFKAFVRESSAYMQCARQLQALVGGVVDVGRTNPLFLLERALGVTQHHDAIAGTATQAVNDDYVAMLERGRAGAFASIAASLANATGYAGAPFALCPLANVTLCPALERGEPAVVVAYNPLGQAAAAAPVRLSVGLPAGVASYAVTDGSGRTLEAQLVPLSARDRELRALFGGANASASANATAWLCFTGDLPAAGFAAFFLEPVGSAAGAPRTHASVVVALRAGDGDQTISNGRLTLTVAAATGFLARYQDASTGVDVPLAQSWSSYVGYDGASSLNGSSQASGAYIFRPRDAAPSPLAPGPAAVVLVLGPVVSEFQSTYAYVSQSTRLWAGVGHAEVEWTVGPVDVADGNSHEVVTRYDSGLATGQAWTTDANCREHQLRRRNWRANWTAHIAEPVSANYAPVPCVIKATGAGAAGAAVTVAVAVDRSEGGTRLADGQLELRVHRRMRHDDGRGVGENLDEPGVDGRGLIVRGRHLLVAAPAAQASAIRPLQLAALALPETVRAFAPLVALSPAQWRAAYTSRVSLLAAPLPENVHLATVHALSDASLLLRLAHAYELGEDAVGSRNVTVALAALLSGGRPITGAFDATLQGSQPLAGVARRTYRTDGGATFATPVLPAEPAGAQLDVELAPMQLRTLMCTR
jgi:hypothetical protein